MWVLAGYLRLSYGTTRGGNLFANCAACQVQPTVLFEISLHRCTPSAPVLARPAGTHRPPIPCFILCAVAVEGASCRADTKRGLANVSAFNGLGDGGRACLAPRQETVSRWDSPATGKCARLLPQIGLCGHPRCHPSLARRSAGRKSGRRSVPRRVDLKGVAGVVAAVRVRHNANCVIPGHHSIAPHRVNGDAPRVRILAQKAEINAVPGDHHSNFRFKPCRLSWFRRIVVQVSIRVRSARWVPPIGLPGLWNPMREQPLFLPWH
jgi:hypothetical protein